MVAISNPKDMINTELDLSTAIKEIGILTQSNIELKETKEGLVGVLEEVVIWDNERIEFHNINDKSLKIIHTELKKHKQS